MGLQNSYTYQNSFNTVHNANDAHSSSKENTVLCRWPQKQRSEETDCGVRVNFNSNLTILMTY